MSLPDYGNLPSMPPVKLSFKCRTYGNIEHTPCAGTIDDGTDENCQCRCHTTEN